MDIRRFDSSSGVASSSGAVGRGFKSPPCHTKGVINKIKFGLDWPSGF